ncbi:hypothetical protein SCLCIDRAFT_310846 [Scleroderma citrinum Foug A]|uniref:Uncharacterized protein n=1 Tax=Scleroderma citrinum Foug A TaxID=1036808 RepID=A0A0C3DFM9_9AGAM|nr:hypothetical protein SCLCIDRAFT_310846 [Scleroderma citrinum Foug A]
MRDSLHPTLKIEQIIIFGRHGSLFSSGPLGVSISNAIVLARLRGMCHLSSTPFVCYHSIVTMWRQGGTRWDLSSVYTIAWHFWYMHRSNDGTQIKIGRRMVDIGRSAWQIIISRDGCLSHESSIRQYVVICVYSVDMDFSFSRV